MKALICEMCNSTDIVKQDGFYVCQSCGTKYSVEEAKKLMIDGPVDVSGSTVKVDKSDSTDKLLQLARQAKSEGNAQNASKYYEMVAIDRPDDWESNFYSVYYQAAQCTLATIPSAAANVTNKIPSTLRLMKEALPEANRRECCNVMLEDVERLVTMMCNASHDHFNEHFDTNFYQTNVGRSLSNSSNERLLMNNGNRIDAAVEISRTLASSFWTILKDKELAIKATEKYKKHGSRQGYIELLKGPDPERAAQEQRKLDEELEMLMKKKEWLLCCYCCLRLL